MARRKRPTRLPSNLPRGKVHNTLKRLGFVVAREGQKHTIFRDPDDPGRLLSIPRHSRIKRNLLRHELKRVGVSEERFMARY
jgi:predicted RNA binding protein YcfA (HicA-like mRNA interferase family)